ncbi:Chloroperoxidase [Apiospora kogelbergensis]|uniref:Chloroperoxidase n=1 Tax=Apiospora kogelbergensis TaxID=1337665 RepID=A0AAW0QFJ9_9PEZI
MKSLSVLITLWVAAPSYAHPHLHWAPPGPGDVRGPCPMLNSLANHNYLPHNGKNFDVAITKKALSDALNIDEELGQFLFEQAVTTNPTPNATVWSLANLARHNVLEHDASFSRQDAYFGSPVKFNATIFAETQSYWHGPVINTTMAAKARVARIRTSNATNPEFGLSQTGVTFSLGEAAAYLMFLGERVNLTAPKNVVEYLFENERLPTKLGWKRPEPAVGFPDLQEAMARLFNETDPDIQILVRRGMHG